MSHIENDKYEEGVIERFRESATGATKKKMIDELREMGFSRTADQLIEDWYTERTKWLSDKNLENKDVFKDEKGRECYKEEYEAGTFGEEDYRVSTLLEQIPEELDVNYWLSN